MPCSQPSLENRKDLRLFQYYTVGNKLKSNIFWLPRKNKWERSAAYDFFFSHLGEKTYSIMNDVRCYRLFHFDFFIANQMIRSTVHVTHYVWLGWAPTMIGEHCLSGVFSRFFMYDVVASTLQKCRFSYPCWSGKNAGTAGWITSLLSMHLCVSVFFVTRSQEPPFLNDMRVSVHWLIGRVVLVQILDLDQPLCLLSKYL